jgi:hypothetical protein
MPLFVLLSSLAFAIASPVFADEARDESVEALSDLAPESASDVASDLSVVEDFERQMDRALTAEVSRMLDAIVADRTDQQMRWLAQRYFDGTAGGDRASPGASPVAVVSPANSR